MIFEVPLGHLGFFVAKDIKFMHEAIEVIEKYEGDQKQTTHSQKTPSE